MPNTLITENDIVGKKYYTQVKFDIANSTNVELDELKRYAREVIELSEIYPYDTQAEKDYFNGVSPNMIVRDGNHNQEEMNRYNKVIKEIIKNGITSSRTLIRDILSLLLEELSFMHLKLADFNKLIDFGTVVYTSIPEGMSQRLKWYLEVVDDTLTTIGTNDFTQNDYKITNRLRLSEFDGQLTIPVVINMATLKSSVNYIRNNTPGNYVYDTNETTLPPSQNEQFTLVDVTTNTYTVQNTDRYVSVNYAGEVTITLPANSVFGVGDLYISDASGNAELNNITIVPSGTDTIALDTFFQLVDDNASVHLHSNGVSNWFVN